MEFFIFQNIFVLRCFEAVSFVFVSNGSLIQTFGFDLHLRFMFLFLLKSMSGILLLGNNVKAPVD